MEIRVWQSYSCNNSSSFWLVARFDDPKVIKDVESELNTLFKAHAKEIDESFDSGEDDDAWEKPSEVAKAFAKKNGIDWKNYMMWGDGGMEGDEPELAAEGNELIIYHGYCAGGLPPEVTKYLQKKGGTVVGTSESSKGPDDLTMSLTVELANPNAQIRKDVEKVFKSLPAPESDDDDEDGGEAKYPWNLKKRSSNEAYGQMSYFCDGKTLGLYFPIEPREMEAMKKWLQSGGGKNPSIQICKEADFKKFRAIAAAKCTECGGGLEYLDPRKTGIESEQLSCPKCGGMFDLTTFTKKKKKKAAAPVGGAVAPRNAAAAAPPKKTATKKKAATTTATKKKKKAAPAKKAKAKAKAKATPKKGKQKK